MVTKINFSVKLTELEERKVTPREFYGMGSIVHRDVDLFDFEWYYDKRNGPRLVDIPIAVLLPEVLEEVTGSIRESIKDKYRGIR